MKVFIISTITLSNLYVSHEALYWQRLTTLVNIHKRLQASQLNTLKELSHQLVECILGHQTAA